MFRPPSSSRLCSDHLLPLGLIFACLMTIIKNSQSSTLISVQSIKQFVVYKGQGTNARKVISEVYTFFVLQCTVFGRKSKHKTDVTAWHGIHFHKNNLWNILVIWNYYVNYSCLQISPRERVQYVRRVYATTINFSCIFTLALIIKLHKMFWFTNTLGYTRRTEQ